MNGLKQKVVLQSSLGIRIEDNFLLIETKEKQEKINLNNISTIYVNYKCSLIPFTLIQRAYENGISIYFENSKHQIIAKTFNENCPLDSYRKIKRQISWNSENKNILWREILINKIENQIALLKENKFDSAVANVESLLIGKNPESIEGACAKEYFVTMFGKDFNRREESPINSLLNYGYSILANRISRRIHELGYLTQIGIHHSCETNNNNFAYDLIEPFRPIVDRYVFKNKEIISLDSKHKGELISLLDSEILWQGKIMKLDNAIDGYCDMCIDYMNNKKRTYISVRT